MTTKLIVGWMDHSQAKLYWLDGESVTRREHILSGAHGKREENALKPEDVADKERMTAYRFFFDQVIKIVGHGDESLYLLGHDQALRQFRNHCEKNAAHLVPRLFETPADKLTEPQILAHGRKQMK